MTTQVGIQGFLESAGLIGWLRHEKSQLPWDSDGDLGILLEECLRPPGDWVRRLEAICGWLRKSTTLIYFGNRFRIFRWNWWGLGGSEDCLLSQKKHVFFSRPLNVEVLHEGNSSSWTVRHGKIHHAIKNGKPSISMGHRKTMAMLNNQIIYPGNMCVLNELCSFRAFCGSFQLSIMEKTA